jgi:putative transposase
LRIRPRTRGQQGDVLQLKIEVLGHSEERAEADARVRGENAKLKRMYADLALENTAIKGVLSRKL